MAPRFGYRGAMVTLILATQAAVANPPGDDFATLAYAFLALTALVTAVATAFVTPRMKKH